MRRGTADLPLHPGSCPAWLFSRMRRLSSLLSRHIVNEFGTKEFLFRLSDPCFFQALNCALGMDWHSSGSTTTLTAAIKLGISDLDLGVAACGGKGKTSMKTQGEIQAHGESFSFPDSRISSLQKASRLAAKVDNSCIQDSYSLYHHFFLMDEKGNWAIIQQGMNVERKYARRYHWFNAAVFTEGPDSSIAGIEEESALNLVSASTPEARKISLDLIRDNPIHLQKYFSGQTTLFEEPSHIHLPAHHEVLHSDLTEKDWETLRQAYELQPSSYEELVCLRGMGAKKLRALALLSKLIHGTELDWKDPVKYSFAHGGKDGFPFPVQLDDYENSISFLKEALGGLDAPAKSDALRRLASAVG